VPTIASKADSAIFIIFIIRAGSLSSQPVIDTRKSQWQTSPKQCRSNECSVSIVFKREMVSMYQIYMTVVIKW
jgi:hypothetical protein